jgi:hypothetical protein
MTIKEECVGCVNLEFRAESLGLNYENPKAFVQSQVCNTLRFLFCLLTKSVHKPFWYALLLIKLHLVALWLDDTH